MHFGLIFTPVTSTILAVVRNVLFMWMKKIPNKLLKKLIVSTRNVVQSLIFTWLPFIVASVPILFDTNLVISLSPWRFTVQLAHFLKSL